MHQHACAPSACSPCNTSSPHNSPTARCTSDRRPPLTCPPCMATACLQHFLFLCAVAQLPSACCCCPQSRQQHQAGRCPTSLSTRSSSWPRLGCMEFHWGPSAKAQVRSTVRPSCSDSLRSMMPNDYPQTFPHTQRAVPEPFTCSAPKSTAECLRSCMHAARRVLDSARDQKASSCCMAGMAGQAG